MARDNLRQAHGNASYATQRLNNLWKSHGLKSSPFSNDFKFSYGCKLDHFQEIIDSIKLFCDSQDIMAVVSGEVGIGKTILLDSVVSTCSREFHKIVCDTDMHFAQLILDIAKKYHIKFNTSQVQDQERTAFLQQELSRKGQQIILLLDDAYKMPTDCLKSLIDSSVSSSGAIKLILVGNNQLFERVIKHIIHTGHGARPLHFVVPAVPQSQLKSYLHSCFVRAGWYGPLPEINQQQLQQIYMLSEGVPRRINIAAEQVLGNTIKPVSINENLDTNTYKNLNPSLNNTSVLRKIFLFFTSTITLLAISLAVFYWYKFVLTKDYVFNVGPETKIASSSDLRSNSEVKENMHENKIFLKYIEENLQNDIITESVQQDLLSKNKSDIINNEHVSRNISPVKINNHIGMTQDGRYNNSLPQNDLLTKDVLQYMAGFTIQLIASHNLQALIATKRSISDVDNVFVYETTRDNKPWYTMVYGSFIKKQDALQSLQRLKKLPSFQSAWVKPMFDVKIALGLQR